MGTQKMQGDDNGMEQKIDKEVFDKFFTESYCPVDYTTVKEEFEQIASQDIKSSGTPCQT